MNHSVFKSQLAGFPIVRVNLNPHKLAQTLNKYTVAVSDVSSNASYSDCRAKAACIKKQTSLKPVLYAIAV